METVNAGLENAGKKLRLTATLGEVADINPERLGSEWSLSYILYVDISSVGEGHISTSPAKLDLDEAPSRAQRIISEWDVVLSTVRPNRRAMFQARDVQQGTVVSTGFAVLRAKPGQIDPRYLYALVFDQSFTDYLVMREQGAAYPAVSPSDIAEAEVSLPPIEEQRRIGHILGTLDDKIELNRRMSATLEEMARALYKSWFIDFDPVIDKAILAGNPIPKELESKAERRRAYWAKTTPDGRPKPLASDLDSLFPDSFQDSTLGPIPSGWAVASFGRVCQNVGRSVAPAQIDPEEVYVGLEHIAPKSLCLNEWGAGKEVSSQKSRFLQDEILFGKLRPYFHKVSIAPLAGICSTDVLVLDATDKRWWAYVALASSEESTIEYVTATSGGTRMPRTSWSDLDRMPVVLSPLGSAEAFGDIIRPVLKRLQPISSESRVLATIRDSLLGPLLQGQLKMVVQNQ